ncbi:hypothetical protein D3C86_1963550 [compost metagenome]
MQSVTGGANEEPQRLGEFPRVTVHHFVVSGLVSVKVLQINVAVFQSLVQQFFAVDQSGRRFFQRCVGFNRLLAGFSQANLEVVREGGVRLDMQVAQG